MSSSIPLPGVPCDLPSLLPIRARDAAGIATNAVYAAVQRPGGGAGDQDPEFESSAVRWGRGGRGGFGRSRDGEKEGDAKRGGEEGEWDRGVSPGESKDPQQDRWREMERERERERERSMPHLAMPPYRKT